MQLSFPNITQISVLFFNYSYAVGSMVPLLSVSRPSGRLSVRNGCIVDKRLVIEENFLHG